MRETIVVKPKIETGTVKSLVELPKELNKRVKIEAAKRGLTLTDTIIAILDENVD